MFLHSFLIFCDIDTLAATFQEDIAVHLNEVRQIQGDERIGLLATVLHLWCQAIHHAVKVHHGGPGELVRGAEPSKWSLLWIFINKIRQATGIFGDGLQCGCGILAAHKLQLEALDLAGERSSLNINPLHVTHAGSNLEAQKIELIGGQVVPETVLPRDLDIRQLFFYQERVSGNLSNLSMEARDQCIALRQVLVEILTQKFEACIKQRYQHWKALGKLFIGRFVEIILPEIYNQKSFFIAIWQTFFKDACGIATGAAPDHLLQLNARLHRLHEDQVDHFWYIDACF